MIPEFRKDKESANYALFIYGKYDPVCFSPFGIDRPTPEEDPYTKTYAALTHTLEGPLLFSEDRALLNKWFNQLQFGEWLSILLRNIPFR